MSELNIEVRMFGTFRLMRMVPLLELIDTPFIEDIKKVAFVCREEKDWINTPDLSRVARWYASSEQADSAYDAYYFQLVGIELALAVTRVPYIPKAGIIIQHSPANFWKTCDDIVSQANGYRMPEFSNMKTTLKGVEDTWQINDAHALQQAGNIYESFERQVHSILEKFDKRRSIASAICVSAGWVT